MVWGVAALMLLPHFNPLYLALVYISCLCSLATYFSCYAPQFVFLLFKQASCLIYYTPPYLPACLHSRDVI